MTEVTVFSGKTTLNRVVAGVTFVDGVGVADTVTDAAALLLFDRQGWTYEETSTLAFDPETITVSETKDIAKATKAELVAYAAANSIDIDPTASKKAILEYINSYDDAAAPEITGQPGNESVEDAAEASFTVTATGTEPLTYQWEVQLLGAGDWEPIEGADEATYTFTAASADSTNKYRCVVANIKGSATSNGSATLTVT